MRLSLLIVIALILLSGCSFTSEDLRQNLLKRASFDLNCSQEQLELTEISRSQSGYVNSYGVRGCGKKVVYVRQLDNTNWLLNSDKQNEEKSKTNLK